MNKKGAIKAIERMPLRPPRFRDRVERALARLDARPWTLRKVLDELAVLVADVRALTKPD